mgnify:CR=1 FL=1
MSKNDSTKSRGDELYRLILFGVYDRKANVLSRAVFVRLWVFCEYLCRQEIPRASSIDAICGRWAEEDFNFHQFS